MSKLVTLSLCLLGTTSVALAQTPTQFEVHTRQGLPADTSPTFKLALADVDGDDVPDLICANMGTAQPGTQNTLLLNDGRGHFTDVTATHLPQRVDWCGAVSVADVDGDGDNDIFFGCSSAQGSTLYLNDGTGKFKDVTGQQFPNMTVTVYASVFCDIDGDQDMDLVARDRVFVNDGKGSFRDETSQRAGSSLSPWGMAAADVDGDKDLDIVMTPSSGGPVLWINDGTGKFTDRTAQIQTPSGFTGRGEIVLQDLNGDGAPDLVCGNYFRQALLWLNDGKGNFSDATAARMPAYSGNRCYSILGGDLDLDGDVDLVLCDGANLLTGGLVNRVYLNDGKGTFTDGTAARSSTYQDDTVSGAIGDVDQDGDPDVVFGNWSTSNVIWQNRHRHVYAPAAPQLGKNYTVEFYGMPGYATTPQALVSFGGFLPMPVRVRFEPWGVLGINLAGLFLLPGQSINSPGGKASFSIPIPNDPGFKGFPLYWQALILQVPVQRFTNTFGDKVQ